MMAGVSGGPERSRDEAVAELYQRHRLSMLRLACFLVTDRGVAEDIVQDAFVGLHRRWADIDVDAAVPYLRRSVVNGARNVFRHRDVARRHLRVAEPEVGPSADWTVLIAEEHREVVVALRRLPERQREVLVLRYWSELNEAEIAVTLRVSRGTVKSSAARGLAALERILEGDRG